LLSCRKRKPERNGVGTRPPKSCSQPSSCLTSTQISTAVRPHSCSLLGVFDQYFAVDLYGNDEPDFTETVLEENAENASAEPAQPQAQNTQLPPVASHPKTSSTPHKHETNAQPSSSAKTEEAPATSLPTPPTTQQIPTFEQPLAPDYMDGSVQRIDGGYQNIPVPERTVRPSEMKDEG
jgi:hypothetical protein